MSTTVKSSAIQKITPKELFSVSFVTRELYDDEKIEIIKQKILESKKDVMFFERDKIIFYSFSSKELNGPNRGKVLIFLDYLKDYSLKPETNFWRFGVVDKETGEISMLFDGKSVAKQKNLFDFFKIAKTIVATKFKNKKVITFTIK